MRPICRPIERAVARLLRLSPAAPAAPRCWRRRSRTRPSISGAAISDGDEGAAPAHGALCRRGGPALGDLLGQKYIELTFGADAKAQITQMVDALEKAMAEDIAR